MKKEIIGGVWQHDGHKIGTPENSSTVDIITCNRMSLKSWVFYFLIYFSDATEYGLLARQIRFE